MRMRRQRNFTDGKPVLSEELDKINAKRVLIILISCIWVIPSLVLSIYQCIEVGFSLFGIMPFIIVVGIIIFNIVIRYNVKSKVLFGRNNQVSVINMDH